MFIITHARTHACTHIRTHAYTHFIRNLLRRQGPIGCPGQLNHQIPQIPHTCSTYQTVKLKLLLGEKLMMWRKMVFNSRARATPTFEEMQQRCIDIAASVVCLFVIVPPLSLRHSLGGQTIVNSHKITENLQMGHRKLFDVIC